MKDLNNHDLRLILRLLGHAIHGEGHRWAHNSDLWEYNALFDKVEALLESAKSHTNEVE